MADPGVIIDIEPEWTKPIEISYGFATVVQDNPYFNEQRRPLIDSPVRGISCQYSFSEEELQRARNVLMYGMPRLCCVPVYNEPIFSTSFSGSSITATNDLSYMWNVENCDYGVLLDFVSGQSEMVKIASVAGQVISLVSAIVGTWVAAQTVFYPAFAGTISSIKNSELTSTIGNVEIEFTEITESAEATEEWVGLTEQDCINCGELYGDSYTSVNFLDSSWAEYYDSYGEYTRSANSISYEVITAHDGGYTHFYWGPTAYTGFLDQTKPITKIRFKFELLSINPTMGEFPYYPPYIRLLSVCPWTGPYHDIQYGLMITPFMLAVAGGDTISLWAPGIEYLLIGNKTTFTPITLWLDYEHNVLTHTDRVAVYTDRYVTLLAEATFNSYDVAAITHIQMLYVQQYDASSDFLASMRISEVLWMFADE